MESNPDVMMSSNEAGVARVMNEVNYAFFMESGSIEYEVERKCDLTQIGGLLDNKGYGIVMRKSKVVFKPLEEYNLCFYTRFPYPFN